MTKRRLLRLSLATHPDGIHRFFPNHLSPLMIFSLYPLPSSPHPSALRLRYSLLLSLLFTLHPFRFPASRYPLCFVTFPSHLVFPVSSHSVPKPFYTVLILISVYNILTRSSHFLRLCAYRTIVLFFVPYHPFCSCVYHYHPCHLRRRRPYQHTFVFLHSDKTRNLNVILSVSKFTFFSFQILLVSRTAFFLLLFVSLPAMCDSYTPLLPTDVVFSSFRFLDAK